MRKRPSSLLLPLQFPLPAARSSAGATLRAAGGGGRLRLRCSRHSAAQRVGRRAAARRRRRGRRAAAAAAARRLMLPALRTCTYGGSGEIGRGRKGEERERERERARKTTALSLSLFSFSLSLASHALRFLSAVCRRRLFLCLRRTAQDWGRGSARENKARCEMPSAGDALLLR